MAQRPLDVLVVGDGRVDRLAACLGSVRKHLDDATLRVWNDRSASGPQLRALAADHPEADWVFSPTDVGPTAAVNRLVARGEHDTLLLEPGTELVGPLLLTRAALGGPRVGVAAPVVANPPGRSRPWDSARRPPSVTRALVEHAGWAERLRHTRFSDLYATPPTDVDGHLTGPALLVARVAWQEVGPLEEDPAGPVELLDWQRRARARGLRLLLVNEPEVRRPDPTPAPQRPDLRQWAADGQAAARALAVQGAGNFGPAAAVTAGHLALDRVQPTRRAARRAARVTVTERSGSAHGVVLTTPSVTLGGAERQRVLLANELARRGHPVTVVCLQALGTLRRELHPDVRVVLRPFWQPVLDTGDGPTVLVSGTTRIDVGFATAWARLGSGRRRRRWLVAAHEFPRSGPAYAPLHARAIGRSDGVIALSAAHWAALHRDQHVHDRHYCVPNGVTLQPRRPFAPGPALRLGFLGRIVEFKNPHLLVEALSQLAEFPWRLDLFGDGEDLPRLRALVPPAVHDRVHWRGQVPGPDDAFAEMDVLCMPSRHDAFPLVALEAMARGVPVMASAIGGLPEMLGHGRNGVLVPTPTLEAWVAALREALEHPNRLGGVAEAGWERVRAEYTVGVMADGYQRVMTDALAR